MVDIRLILIASAFLAVWYVGEKLVQRFDIRRNPK